MYRFALLIVAFIAASTPSLARDAENWMKDANFILGVYNVEDMLQIPDTRWIVGSGLRAYNAGFVDNVIKKNYLHVFDAETETGRQIEPEEIAILPDTGTYPDCKPPDWETFGAHGIALSERKGDVVTLYAVNHGGREAVEVFKIDVSGDYPRFIWVGCLLVPSDGWPDAVAWLPDTDGVLVTAMSDPEDPKGALQKQMKGEPVGWVKEWNPKSGWRTLPGTEDFSAPNGIVVSKDGQTVWVAQSAGGRVSKVARGGSDPEVVHAKVDGPPDNLRWSADRRTIFVAVHTASPEEFENQQIAAAKTGGNLLTTFNITRLDPDTMETEIYMPSGVYGVLGGGTTAIEVGDRLWVGSTKSDRIGIFDLD